MIDHETMLDIIHQEGVEAHALGDQSVRPPVLTVWFHTVGVGQHFGTVKFHRFEDCGQLRKDRPYWAGPIKKWQKTNVYTRVEYLESDVPESRRCKICERYHTRQNNQEETR